MMDSAAGKDKGFLRRTEALLGEEVLEKFADTRISIAGLGGVGGAILTGLVRLGFGKYSIADPGKFDPPDMNRQMAATHDTLGQNKAKVYEKFIKSVNPGADVRLFTEGVKEGNIDAFLEDSDLLIEALDLKVPVELRLQVASRAREQGLYNISAPIVAFGTLVAIADPKGESMEPFMRLVDRARVEGVLPKGFAEHFPMEQLAVMRAQMLKGVVPSIAVAPMLCAAAVCTEAIMIVGGKAVPGWRAPLCLPDLQVLEVSGGNYNKANVNDWINE